MSNTDEAAARLREYADRLCTDHVPGVPLHEHGTDIAAILDERDRLLRAVGAFRAWWDLSKFDGQPRSQDEWGDAWEAVEAACAALEETP